MTGQVFRDRSEAGRALAAAVRDLLRAHPGMDDPVVLALPRGGVPVALEVAEAIGAPLDLVMVRKIGAPHEPELAAAAVVDGEEPERVVNREVVRMTGMTEAEMEAGTARELAEIARRRALWLRGRPPVAVAGRDAIVVDDGVATGATVRAALRALRRRGVRSLTLAVPVAPADTLAVLRREVDHAVCLATPGFFRAIGCHYLDFSQLEDAEVTRLLARADRADHGAR